MINDAIGETSTHGLSKLLGIDATTDSNILAAINKSHSFDRGKLCWDGHIAALIGR